MRFHSDRRLQIKTIMKQMEEMSVSPKNHQRDKPQPNPTKRKSRET
jgi:hypothetical protein